jgi:hypothetical protein
MANILRFPAKAPRDVASGQDCRADDHATADIDAISRDMEMLTRVLVCQEKQIEMIGRLLKTLPEGPQRKYLRGQMFLLKLIVARAFIFRDDVIKTIGDRKAV